jgi:hypothetical protein
MVFLRSALAIATLLTTVVAPAFAAGACDILPSGGAVTGWQMRDAARTYTRADLYEYIDGNADLFLSYGFADAAVGDYAPASGEGWISVDVYNMGTPLQAFGIFGVEKPVPGTVFANPPPTAALGAQEYASDGLIAFWKGPYYVKVSLVEGEDRDAARRLAEVAAERVADQPAMPAELQRLPAGKRVCGSERYVKSGALGHDFLVEVVSADYPLGHGIGTLHVADLGTQQKAAAGYTKLRQFETSAGAVVADVAGVGEKAFAVRDSYYGETVAAVTGRFLVIAMSGKASREPVTRLGRAGVGTATATASVGSASTGAACPLGGSCAEARPKAS